ncbi:MAG: protein arginine kinase [Candidatus Krumholzibacteriota bacterium]|nr:protein arginine kinase [Candidatus Krumholzibacteriota bacterium]
MGAIDELISEPASWLSGQNEESELVMSSRVRLARNLDLRSFTHRADAAELAAIRDEVRGAIGETASLGGAIVIDLDDAPEPDRMLLAERRLVSLAMVKKHVGRSLVVDRTESMSVMINEEDHLRLQAVSSGLSLGEAFARIDGLDDEIDGRLPYAWSERLGYLTACATNVGTGMRVSAMVHLPGLVRNKDIAPVLDGLSHVRLTVRGAYGEGSQAMGNFFQVSNSITLGVSEADTVRNLVSHVRKLLEFEKKAREVLMRKARSLLEDSIWRAAGILRTARVLTSKEAMGLISSVRMGVGMGIITDVGLADINEMTIMIQPMHLQFLFRRAMDAEERDRCRADYVRARFGG